MERRLTHVNWMEIRDRQAAGEQRLLLPVGSLEAHGAIAQGTDILAPEWFCTRLAEPLGAWIAPCIPYGVTRSLAAYPGTVHVEASAFTAYTGEVLRSFLRRGFREILVVNGHGGHSQALRELLGGVHLETGGRLAVVDWWTECYDLCEEHLGVPGGHAGADEAALVRAAAPELRPPARTSEVKGWVMRPSTAAFPVAGSLLSGRPEGLRFELDAARATAYSEAAAARLLEIFRAILEGWGAIQPGGLS